MPPHIYKEVPDTCGADVTWIERDASGAAVLWRCQLKLGTSRFEYADMTKAIDALHQHSQYSPETRKSLGVQSVQLVLAMTRPLGREADAAAYAGGKNVELWGHAHLAAKLWHPALQKWARSVGASAYYKD